MKYYKIEQWKWKNTAATYSHMDESHNHNEQKKLDTREHIVLYD